MLLALLLLLPSCKRSEPPKAAPQVVTIERASVATVQRRQIAIGPRISGTLQPQETASIIAEIAGTARSVRAAEGEVVTQGSVLAVIVDETAAENARNARTAVQAAQTSVSVARRDLDRNQSLASAGAIARRDVDVARSQVATAQAQLAQARSQLATANERVGDQTVTASMSGTISEKQVSEGTVVTAGAPLFTIVDLTTLQLEGGVTSDAVGALTPGAAVDVEVRGYPGEIFRGRITRIAPNVDPATGLVQVFVSIPNMGRRLIGGLFAEGTVKTVSRFSLVVPAGAVDESTSTPFVMRLRNGVAERVVVRIGVRNEAEGIVEILSGLNQGESVLSGPARTIAPGTRIRVR